jgi:two-component system, LytTR family, response regulator LytT
MRIVIIEDEKLVAKDLARTIKEINPEVDIIAFIESIEDGIKFFNEQPTVDLIFSDIQLGDGMSFEIFEKVKNQVPVVFCTAFNQYALDAFNTIGIDYILKPITKQNVEKAISKYNAIKSNFKGVTNLPEASQIEKLMGIFKGQLQHVKIPAVIIHQGDKIIPIEGDNIAFFYIENSNVFAFTFEQKKLLVNKKLDLLEAQYVPYFFRANRQFLVNRKAIKEASQYFHRKLLISLVLPFKEDITVGKEKVTEFLDWLTTN